MRRIIVVLAAMAAMVVVYAGAAWATSLSEVEPNDSIADAQNIDGSFSLDFDPNIGSAYTNTSESLPHATVNGMGNETKDYYSFTVSQAGDGVILDVDEGIFCDPEGCPGFDSWIELYDSSGQSLANNDDESTEWGQGGSISGVDSFLEYTFETPGTYYVAVGSCCVGPVHNGVIYQLHVSIGELPEHPYLCQGQLPTIEGQSGRSTNGTKGDDVIAGTEGRDTINGGGGNDTICGKDGTNTINGGAGDDFIYSGAGDDSLTGGAGNDYAFGGDGNDLIMGDQGSDTLSGEGGDDTIDGGLSTDYISGGDGTDKCSLGELGRDECELAFGSKVNR